MRSVVGLDRNAAKSAFAEFLSAVPLHPDQITFLDAVVNYLVKNGVMEPNAMFDAPFTNINAQSVHGEQESRKIIETLRQINKTECGCGSIKNSTARIEKGKLVTTTKSSTGRVEVQYKTRINFHCDTTEKAYP